MIDRNVILNIDCLEGLKTLPDQSVNCCVTSPPYFGLRDYGYDGQIGLEETPEMFVQKLVDVFWEVKRVLKNDGTLWLNLGDSYASNTKGSGGPSAKQTSNAGSRYEVRRFNHGVKEKDLMGIPWMVAFALRADGWYLRQDIIWHKPNPMPESVTDRCTKSHEYIFLLSKSNKYYYDHESIKTQLLGSAEKYNSSIASAIRYQEMAHNKPATGFKNLTDGMANKKSVWSVSTKPFSEAHFATFPEDLIVDCIKAGCPEGGVVLDPFMGAGTTALVARKLHRDYIGFELNPEYIRIAKNRLQAELGMFV